MMIAWTPDLTITLCVMDAAPGRCPDCDSHVQRPDRQVPLHAVTDRPADDAPGMRIQDDSFDIGDPVVQLRMDVKTW